MQSNVNLRAALAESWGILRENPKQWILVLLVFVIPAIPFPFLEYSEENPWPSILLGIASPIWIALGLWLSTGLTLLSIRAAAGEPWSVGNLFDGGRWIMRFLGIHLSILVLMIPCMVVWGLAYFLLFISTTQEDAMLASSAEAAGELAKDFDFSPASIALSLLVSLVISWISAWFYFAWYLAVDKDMPWMEAEKHSFKMVRGMLVMLTLVLFVLCLPMDFLSVLPIPALITMIFYQVTMLFWSLIAAILYRERLREMEAEGGHPLGRRSMLSLPREDDPWEVADEAVVENQQVAD
jgi:hypothetical protein